MLAKFALNDLPHAAGVLGEFCPKPRYFTHDTENWGQVLDEGHINPSITTAGKDIVKPAPSVSVSLDGLWAGSGRTFMFDVAEIYKYRAKPVFYLGTSIMDYEYYGGFTVYDVSCIWAAEVEIFGQVPVSEKDLTTERPSTPLRDYVTSIIQDLRPIVGSMLFAPDKEEPVVPTKEIGRRITAYNQMVARMFGVDYDKALLEVENTIRTRKRYWVQWW